MVKDQYVANPHKAINIKFFDSRTDENLVSPCPTYWFDSASGTVDSSIDSFFSFTIQSHAATQITPMIPVATKAERQP